MFRFLLHFFSITPFTAFLILVYTIVLVVFKNKTSKKIWCLLCCVPLMVSIVHFIVYYVPHNSTFLRVYAFMYVGSLIVALIPFLYNKKRLCSVISYISIFIVFGCFIMTLFETINFESVHNLSYYSYTDSFKKTINILKKEYVLNKHKEIDYDYLYNKYYPSIEEAQNKKDAQLYYKTMFEFSKNFKDGHFHFGIWDEDLEKLVQKYEFVNGYANRDYGFGSVLLSDGNIAAIGVEKHSEAYAKGLRNGMIITKKDGEDVRQILNTIMTPLDPYPVYEDEKLFNSFFVFAQGNEEIRVSFLDEENKENTITVKSINDVNSRSLNLYFALTDTVRLDNLATRMLDEDTGYIYIQNEYYSPFKGAIGYMIDDSSYLTEVVDKKLEELKKKGMTNLVIDLRGNEGGYFTESEAIASLFTNNKIFTAKIAKYNSNLYDKTYLRGNGKYSELPVTVLVNSNTKSAGDFLAYLLSLNFNTKIVGYTTTNNSAQSIGGIIFLSGGESYITYPIYRVYDDENKIFIDPSAGGEATIKLTDKVEFTKDNIVEIFLNNNTSDYLLRYVLDKYN